MKKLEEVIVEVTRYREIYNLMGSERNDKIIAEEYLKEVDNGYAFSIWKFMHDCFESLPIERMS